MPILWPILVNASQPRNELTLFAVGCSSLLNKIVQLTGHANMVASMQVMLILCIIPNYNLILLDYHILTSTSSRGQILMIVESAIHCTV